MPDKPVGSRDQRITRAIHLSYTTDKSQAEIADVLGVSQAAVSEYLNSPPAAETEQFLAEKQAEVREMAVAEYQRQLAAAAEAEREAEEPVELWRDENGDVQTVEVRDGQGNLLDRNAVPQAHEMDADTTEQYYRREEMREILEHMRTLVGADAPEEQDVNVNMDADHTFDAKEGVSAEFVSFNDDEEDDGDS